MTKTVMMTTLLLLKNSFPSGHTSAAFIGPTFIHQRYGFVQAIPLYMLASFVGYTYAMLSDMLIGYLRAIAYTDKGDKKYKQIKEYKNYKIF
jgi:hypothetical protein